MKYFLLTAFLCNTFLHPIIAQNDATLVTQGFENPFQLSEAVCNGTGCQVEILPNFFANEAKTSSRVYRETAKPIEGKGSLGMIPIEGFNPTLKINYALANPVNSKSITFRFDAKSMKNGGATSTRYATLKYSFSTDKENTFSEETVVGIFHNENSNVNFYSLQIPISPATQEAATIKLVAYRSKDSSGLSAKVIIDNITIRQDDSPLSNETDTYKGNLKIVDQANGNLTLSLPASGAIFNQMGKEVLTFDDKEIIPTQALPIGVYIIKSSDNGLHQKIYIGNQ